MTEPTKEQDELAHRVIGAAIEVHRRLGPGYLESIYEEALAVEFDRCEIKYARQHEISVDYRGRKIGIARLDFLVGDNLIVELKAVETIAPIHQAQVFSYLKMTGLELGLLINFNLRTLKEGIKRIILT